MENNKYTNGKIYKITDIGYNECYYGSTIERLSGRMGHHRAHYIRYKDQVFNNITVFQLFDKYGIENCKIELLENCPCSSKEELLKREGESIRNNACVNKEVAGRSTKQYREEHKDDRRNYDKAYRDTHKEEKRLKHKASWEANADKVKEAKKKYHQDNINKYKENNNNYRESHKEEIKAYTKAYREKQKATKSQSET